MPLADGEMWQQWLSSYTPPNGSGPIFIVLDGIDQINFDHQGTDEKARIALRKIIQDVSKIGKGKLDIRLLLSCNEGYVAARVPGKLERKAISYINLDRRHCEHMTVEFIEKKLEWVCQGFDSDEDTQTKWPQENKDINIIDTFKFNFLKLKIIYYYYFTKSKLIIILL